VHLPSAGAIAVYRPPADAAHGGPVAASLAALPPARVRIIHGFRPAVDHWQGLGFEVATEAPDAAAGAIVFLPRVRAQARDLIARALAHGGPVIVDGQKTDGIDAVLRALRARVAVATPFAKAHGKCAMVAGPPGALADWILPDLARTPSGWTTAPGVFSADGPDPGSVALARALPEALPGRVADLGAGWGYLAFHVLERAGVAEVALVEAEHAALAAARVNVADPRARFHWADATRWGDPAPFDHVVANPPFHAGRAADPALGAAFIAAAARVLGLRGTLWLVANRRLPYEAPLAEAFGETRVLSQTGGYKLVAATRPRRAAGPRAVARAGR